MRAWGRDRLTTRRLAWAAVLAANLPVPAGLGYLCTDEGGLVGMIVGIGLIWLLGHECWRRQPRLASVVIPGGWFVAGAQFFPILQFLAGTIALRAATLGTATQGDVPPKAMGPLVAFTATLLTAGMLLTAAVLCGLFWRLFLYGIRPHDVEKPQVDRDELA